MMHKGKLAIATLAASVISLPQHQPLKQQLLSVAICRLIKVKLRLAPLRELMKIML